MKMNNNKKGGGSINELPQTSTSLEVAEMVGRTHDNVLKNIRKIIKQMSGVKNHESYFSETSYRNSQNKELPCHLLTKIGCELYSNRMDWD
ncbi:Rha family transcriptional regulator [Enterococcus malodoratus]|uniref:Rha family transcriptional regulator n=1 Tax=Enterococcus malodoratus TaxID=71451 RepID=UPI0039B09B81